MGYSPGLPPGVFYLHSPEVQRLSNLFEAGGIASQYLQSQKSIEYEQNTVIIWKASTDLENESVASFVKNSMVARGFLTSDFIPKISAIPNSLSFLMTFDNFEQAIKAASLSFQISYGGAPLEIKVTRKSSEKSISPKIIQSFHPRRVIVTNIDPDIIDQFDQFVQERFQIDGFYVLPEMRDCCIFDVCPPMQPECAALILNNVVYGSRTLIARAYRSVIARTSHDIGGEYNVLADGVDFHQIIQTRTRITNPSDELLSEGRTLLIFNIIPENIIDDSDEIQMIRFDIIGECKKYGNVISCDFKAGSEFGISNTHGVVIIQFETPESAMSAQEHIAGRRYMGRSAITMLHD